VIQTKYVLIKNIKSRMGTRQLTIEKSHYNILFYDKHDKLIFINIIYYLYKVQHTKKFITNHLFGAECQINPCLLSIFLMIMCFPINYDIV